MKHLDSSQKHHFTNVLMYVEQLLCDDKIYTNMSDCDINWLLEMLQRQWGLKYVDPDLLYIIYNRPKLCVLSGGSNSTKANKVGHLVLQCIQGKY